VIKSDSGKGDLVTVTNASGLDDSSDVAAVLHAVAPYSWAFEVNGVAVLPHDPAIARALREWRFWQRRSTRDRRQSD
jgi:hypothetical protein